MQKQVLVSFSIGKYHDEVLCDVVLMYASHILLGGPWKFDRRANHDDFKNHFSFTMNNKLVTLVPLTPKQVYEDQVRLKQECDSNKKMRRKKREEKEGAKQEGKEIERMRETKKIRGIERKKDKTVDKEK